MKHLIAACLLIGLPSAVGCGQSHTGNYTAEVRLAPGKAEAEDHPLVEAQEKHAKHGEKSLTLKSDGRYVLHTGDRVHEGDWWVTDDNRIAICCDTQNGRRLGKALISEGADKHYDIRDNGELFRAYDGADSNLQVVFVRR